MKLKVDYFFKWLLVPLALVLCNFALAQTTITGTVTDATNGDPLIGANILVKGTSSGTITDFDGTYSLNVPAGATTLEISYTGYSTTTEEINGRTTIDVALSPGELLDEVVVVGYGTQKSKEVTSAITSVDAEDFNKGNVNDPAQLLQGKVAGLTIARPGGNPNGGFNIRLRGLSTAGANTEPLVIIDGVPGASLNSVDPNDIASISVLKDGSAAAIYGTRGASGVILITTKQGSAGRTQIDYNGYVTGEFVARTVDVLTPDEYRNFPGSNDLGSSTEWFDELTRTGVSNVHNLSLSGGTPTTTYRASINYRDVQGVAITTGFNQLNGRLNLTQKALSDRLTVSLDLTSTVRNADIGYNEAFRYATIYNPTAPVRGTGAEFDQYDGYFQEVKFDYYNPVAIMEQNVNQEQDKRLIASIRGNYLLFQGLNVNMFYAQQRENDLDGQYFDKNDFWTGANRNGLANRATEERKSDLFELTGTYETTFGGTEFKLLGGYSYQEFENEGFFASGGNFTVDEFGFNRLSAALDFANGLGNINSFKSSSKLIAFFGRANFNFNDTYYLSASLRREGSTRFGENNRWGLFPGVSASVVLSNLFDVSGIDNLKLRAGFGVTGNQPSDNNLSRLLITRTGSFYYNGAYIFSYGPFRNANPDLKWETKTDISVGLDFSAMDYRLNGSLDFYRTSSEDLILPFNVPVPPNLSNITVVNVGELVTSGIELALDFALIDKENFSYTPQLTFNYFLQNDLISLSTDDFDFGGFRDIANLGSPGQNETPLIRVEEGAPLGQIWGLQLNEGTPTMTNSDGDVVWNFVDTNGDGTISNTDRMVLGNGLPDFQLGLNNTFNIGNWDLNIFLRGVFGHDLVNTFRAFYEAPRAVDSYNVLAGAQDLIGLTSSPQFSSRHVENASFLRLDNMTLGYNFDLPDGGNFSRIRLYLTGQNLFTLTGYEGVDPEVRLVDDPDGDGTGDPLAPGIDRRNTYYNSRSVTFGLNLSF